MKKLISLVFMFLFVLSIAGVSFAAWDKTAENSTTVTKNFESQKIDTTKHELTNSSQIVIAARQGCGNICQTRCSGRKDYSSCYNHCMRNCK